MDKFITSIKKKYRDRLTYREDRWPPCHSSRLIRLELVEKKEKVDPDGDQLLLLEEREDDNKIITKRIPLAYGDLFKVESGKRPVRKVLVEGGAGIGKTTLCIAVAEDWANGTLFEQFELLLLLPLRHPKISKARSLCELLKLLHSSKSVCESIVSYLEEEEGENVLIIADGWDELDKSQQQAGSFLYELFLMELPFASVLITSRPSASAPLRKYMDRFIDVLGFDKENIEEFIQAEFADDHHKAINLSKQLESNPLVESVCSVPLNCAIVCHLWRTLGEALPTTMTELYRKIILNFILRNIRKADIILYHNIKILADFDSLPSDLQQSWWQLCEFAFQALIRNQITFSQEDLRQFFLQESPMKEELLFFGLLQPTETILETGYGVTYHFLHLTFQEYLAALHLVKHPLDKQPTVFHSLESFSDSSAIFYAISESFTMVWRFYFGIYFHESRGKPDIKQVWQHLLGIKAFIDDESDLLLWHCAFEAKSEEVISNILAINLYDQIYDHDDINLSDSDLVNCIDFGEPNNAYDCATIIYAISNIQECSKMDLKFGNCGIRENQIQKLGDVLGNKEGKVQINTLDLSGNKLTDVSICDLFQRASTAFQWLETLDLTGNKIGAESIKSITTALKRLPFNVLSQLDLSNNPLGVSGIKALEDAIRCDTLMQLKKLNLNKSLTGVSCEPRVTLIEAIAVHCPNMEGIDLSHDVPGVSIQAELFSGLQFGKPRVLVLKGSDLNDKFMCELFLRAPSTFQFLEALSLSDNRVGVETIKAISLMLQRTSSNRLEILNLSANPLGAPGMQALEDAVCDGLLRNLQQLSLQKSLTNDADINSALITTFIAALSVQCPSLTSLNLSQNTLSIPGASALARLCMKQLTQLNISETMLGDNGLAIIFLDNVIEISCFGTLLLRDNNIHGSKISCLLANVEQWEKIDLSDNPLGVEGVIPVGRLISSSECCLTTLSLSHCQLTSSEGSLISYNEVIRDLGQQLCQMSPSNTITQLYLTHNNFSEERIYILAGFVYLCPFLEHLSSNHCQINSRDLQQLLCQLSEFQASSPEVCRKLARWNLANNKIDDKGVAVLIDHYLTSLLPRLGCGYSSCMVDDNPVSTEMLGRLEMELKRRYDMDRNARIQKLRMHKNTLLHTDTCLNSESKDFQTQWEVIVALLYQTVVQEVLPTCPSIQLVVVGEQKNNLCASNSSLEKDIIHTQQSFNSDHKPFGESPICNAQANNESTAQDDHNGSMPSLSMPIPHTMHPPADASETIVESQGTHNDNNIIVTSQPDEVSISHSNDHNEQLKKTYVDQPLVETDEESNAAMKQVMTAVPFLTVDDLASVQRATWEGRAKWYNIGLELGLTAGTLDSIKLANQGDPDYCITPTLKEWLSRADLHPSWSGLARSLKAPPVGLGYLAEQLMADLDPNKSCSD